MRKLHALITLLLLTLNGTFASAQGLNLFSPEQRIAVDKSQAIVMGFLERYFGKELPALKHTTLEHKMADDKVFFREGTPSDLYQISDTMPFSISQFDRYYEVKWLYQDEPFIDIVFPAQYDLLLGLSQEEAQQQFKDVILSASKRTEENPKLTDLQPMDDGIWQLKKEHFELESLNDAIYYNKVREDYLPVWDTSFPDYSAANLFHGLIADADYRMYVEQSVYGMKTINYTLSLQQWLNYCAEWGLKTYFAIEEQREDGLLALVIARSRELGFNHLLSVIIPDNFVTDKNAVLKVRLTPYIPTHNVKDLYQKESENHKKIIWQ